MGYIMLFQRLKDYYLNRPVDTFMAMREPGLGIANDDIRKIMFGKFNSTDF